MSFVDDDDSKPWTEGDLKEAMRRINAGEINYKEAEDYYGISPRMIHRQRAIENMRAQLNPEKVKKNRSTSSSSSTRKDLTVLRKPVEISCSSATDVAELLSSGTEEVKLLLNNECDIIYECKICKNLFRSLLNFISHKRIYCCDMYHILNVRSDENEDGTNVNDPSKVEEKIRNKEYAKELVAKPVRITCRKDLTSVLKRIAAVTEYNPDESIVQLRNIEGTSNAFEQALISAHPVESEIDSSESLSEKMTNSKESSPERDLKKENTEETVTNTINKSAALRDYPRAKNYVAEKRFRCPACHKNFTIKKSVLRHLKAVHHKSVEQVERLKSRVQMHYVKKKSNSSDCLKTAVVRKTSSISRPSNAYEDKIKSQSTVPDSLKDNWSKCCPYCDRRFTNRNSYAAHIRGCKRHATLKSASDINTNAMLGDSTKKGFLPVVALPSTLPLFPPAKSSSSVVRSSSFSSSSSSSSTSLASKDVEGIAFPVSPVSTVINSPVVNLISPSKKMIPSLPVESAEATAKKIGIQVRMNYCKESVAQNVTSNSVAQKSPHMETTASPVDDAPSKLVNGHQNRSSATNSTLASKSFRVVYPPVSRKSETSSRIDARKLWIYCEDCGSTTTYGEYKRYIGGNRQRNFSCSLHECKFRCGEYDLLRSHVTDKHAGLDESALDERKPCFIAEATGPERISRSECCRRRPPKSSLKRKTLAHKGQARLPDGRFGEITSTKRKRSRDSSNKAKLAKLDMLKNKATRIKNESKEIADIVRSVESLARSKLLNGVDEAVDSEAGVLGWRTVPASATHRHTSYMVEKTNTKAMLEKKDDHGIANMKNGGCVNSVENRTNTGHCSKSDQRTLTSDHADGIIKQEPIAQNIEENETNRPTSQETKNSRKASKEIGRSSKERIVCRDQLNEREPKQQIIPKPELPVKTYKSLENGISRSPSEDENDKAVLNKAEVLQKADVKPSSKLLAAYSRADVVSSATNSGGDYDLDQSTMTAEDIQRRMMTILFGKDLPADKIKESVMEVCETSPSCSSTSPDSSNGKRNDKKPVECNEEKTSLAKMKMVR